MAELAVCADSDAGLEEGVQPWWTGSCWSETTVGSVKGIGRQAAGMRDKVTVDWRKEERRRDTQRMSVWTPGGHQGCKQSGHDQGCPSM